MTVTVETVGSAAYTVAALLFILALAGLSRRFPALLRRPPAVALALLGRHSLQVFCASVPLSMAGYILLLETDYPFALQVAFALAGAAALLAVAWFCEQYRGPVPQGPRLQAQRS
jgi:hypothetical protein